MTPEQEERLVRALEGIEIHLENLVADVEGGMANVCEAIGTDVGGNLESLHALADDTIDKVFAEPPPSDRGDP